MRAGILQPFASSFPKIWCTIGGAALKWTCRRRAISQNACGICSRQGRQDSLRTRFESRRTCGSHRDWRRSCQNGSGIFLGGFGAAPSAFDENVTWLTWTFLGVLSQWHVHLQHAFRLQIRKMEEESVARGEAVAHDLVSSGLSSSSSGRLVRAIFLFFPLRSRKELWTTNVGFWIWWGSLVDTVQTVPLEPVASELLDEPTTTEDQGPAVADKMEPLVVAAPAAASAVVENTMAPKVDNCPAVALAEAELDRLLKIKNLRLMETFVGLSSQCGQKRKMPSKRLKTAKNPKQKLSQRQRADLARLRMFLHQKEVPSARRRLTRPRRPLRLKSLRAPLVRLHRPRGPAKLLQSKLPAEGLCLSLWPGNAPRKTKLLWRSWWRSWRSSRTWRMTVRRWRCTHSCLAAFLRYCFSSPNSFPTVSQL